ncbi:hypothetical protein MMA231_02514 [Asticcacaulis sp. MM231]|uniref:hypothetical protein n=1 Tax=Asticcacaulis sp. MM231 TaxID=3157666 RepID=UPI0032D5AFD5
MAIPDISTVVEYLPNSPCVAEHDLLFSQNAVATLKRMLTRFGLTPIRIGFRKGDQEKAPGEVLILMRAPDGAERSIGRIMYGLTLEALTKARDALMEDGWEPRPPSFEIDLPKIQTA